MALTTGSTVGRYQILGLLGSGGQIEGVLEIPVLWPG